MVEKSLAWIDAKLFGIMGAKSKPQRGKLYGRYQFRRMIFHAFIYRTENSMPIEKIADPFAGTLMQNRTQATHFYITKRWIVAIGMWWIGLFAFYFSI